MLFDGFWIKLISLYDMRQLTLDVQLVILFNDVRVKLWNGNLVLADKDDTVRSLTISKLWLKVAIIMDPVVWLRVHVL